MSTDPSLQVAVTRMGALFHYAIPRAIYGLGNLGRLYTDIWASKPLWHPLRLVPNMIRPKPLKRFLARCSNDLPSGRVTQFPLLAIQNAIQYQRSHCLAATLRAHIDSGRRFCENVVRDGLENCNAVYTFNSQGLELLKYAKKNRIHSFLDLTIAPFSFELDLMSMEQELFPGWESPLPNAGEFATEFAEREKEEWGYSDIILCGSEFVRDALQSAGGPSDRCVVVPYCFESRVPPPKRCLHNRRLRVLTVGTVCLRKGLQYVARVAERLNREIDFRVVGPVAISSDAIAALQNVVELVGQVPRSEVLDHFRWADVFLLPSLCEGSATVCYEALAMGLPVICTPNTGSTVKAGLDGFIVPIREIDAIIEKLLLLNRDRKLLENMSNQAIGSANLGSMKNYMKRLSVVLNRIEV